MYIFIISDLLQVQCDSVISNNKYNTNYTAVRVFSCSKNFNIAIAATIFLNLFIEQMCHGGQSNKLYNIRLLAYMGPFGPLPLQKSA